MNTTGLLLTLVVIGVGGYFLYTKVIQPSLAQQSANAGSTIGGEVGGAVGELETAWDQLSEL